LIVTNAPHIVYLVAGRRSFTLPRRQIFVTGRRNKHVNEELAQWRDILAKRGGYAFFVSAFDAQLANVNDLRRALRLDLVATSSRENLYRVSGAP